ncbi:hypothetical protein EIP91_010563 [Steccherinum ochraceum]|uniref:Uncharacterized protein n=1 Tax=Steccherinum ochraceum TaxID=92696 RepID=A0A4V2MX24_9APHY|nr:hypothetical protein EIP91_010563 [Steccherinum ochraceum]
MMMTRSMLALAVFAISATAQSITIAAPTDGSTVTAGQAITVDIARPNTLSPSQEVSVAIGLLNCGKSCAGIDPSQRFGEILFAGPYAPTQQPSGPDHIDFYQNFTVTIPQSFAGSQASLNVAHFNLIGAGPFPNLETKNITLNFAAST